MTTRRPPEISDEQIRDALTRMPDPQDMAEDLALIVAAVDRTHQGRRWQPAWMTAGSARTRGAASAFAVLAVLVALAIALGVIVGSRPRLPPPFGLAKPGLVAFDLNGDIYVGNADGTARRQLTAGQDADIRPTWSPDGTAIAYESRLPDLSWAVIVMSADGAHRVTLADGLTQIGGIAWSPDSHRVAFGAHITGPQTNSNENYDWRIYIADADRPGAAQLGGPDLYGLAPSWSPDGREVAFKRVYPCCGAPGDVALWIIGADGRNPRRLSSMKELYNNLGGGDAFWNTAWSPDGKRLAFLAEGLAGAYDVFVINADGTDERNISNSPQEEYWPSWSPDGSRIAFPRMSEVRPKAGFTMPVAPASREGTLVVVDPDGTHAVPMTGPPVDSDTAIWSPDGTRLLGYVFDPNHDHNSAIAIFDPSGRLPPMTIPADGLIGASWQRLAP
jgi:Tol biopolymer transport system component